MSKRQRLGLFVILLLAFLAVFPPPSKAQGPGEPTLTIVGRLVNKQGAGIPGASIEVLVDGKPQAILVEGKKEDAAETLSDGSFIIKLSLSEGTLRAVKQGKLVLSFAKPSYRGHSLAVEADRIVQVGEKFLADVGEVTLERHIGPAFFIATAVFLGVFILIALRVLHETTTSLLGAVLILSISYFLGTSNPDFRILSFKTATEYIDFNTIFLVMAMMIMVALIGQTGVFQWLAFTAYRITQGRAWRLAVLLTVVTAIVSALLNNVTVMLLIAPITIEIALVLGIHPFSLLIPEVLASNIGGAATLIGDPPNTMISSYAGLGFGDFLVNMGPIVTISMAVLVAMTKLFYGREYGKAHLDVSPSMLKKLEEDSRITDLPLLKKALIVFALTIALFFIEDFFHMPPCVAALMGATTLLVWVRPPLSKMLREVDWTTLLFFIALFIIIGGIQEVGLIQMIAETIERVAGDSLTLAIVLIAWTSGLASAVISNIPFTAAMLPIVAFLTKDVPGAESNVLYWALSVGACFGGNATSIGAAANIVTAGLADRAGYHISFGDFLKVGAVVTFATIFISTIWLLIRY